MDTEELQGFPHGPPSGLADDVFVLTMPMRGRYLCSSSLPCLTLGVMVPIDSCTSLHNAMEALYQVRTHPGRAHGAVGPRYKGKDFPHGDEEVELMEGDAYDVLGYSFPTWKKWMILSVMFYIQIAINLNASLYANGVKGIAKKFGISEQAARVPQLTFLCAYAFGCELWAPWSEELGRWPTQQLSLFLGEHLADSLCFSTKLWYP